MAGVEVAEPAWRNAGANRKPVKLLRFFSLRLCHVRPLTLQPARYSRWMNLFAALRSNARLGAFHLSLVFGKRVAIPPTSTVSVRRPAESKLAGGRQSPRQC